MSNSDSASQPPVPPSSPNPTPSGGPQLSQGQMILLGSAVVLLISSFLPWFHISFMGVSGNVNGWHHLGTLVWILVILLLVTAGAQIAGVLPVEKAMGDLIVAGLGALIVIFGVIDLIQWISDGHLGFGFYIGVVGFIGFAYGLFDLVKSSDVLNTAKSLQGNAGGDA